MFNGDECSLIFTCFRIPGSASKLRKGVLCSGRDGPYELAGRWLDRGADTVDEIWDCSVAFGGRVPCGKKESHSV